MRGAGNLSLDRMQHYQNILTPEAFNDLQIQQLKAQAHSINGAQIASAMTANANDKTFLDNLSSNQLDAGYKDLIKTRENEKGSPLTLQEELAVARTFDTAIPAVNQKITSGIQSKNPQVAYENAVAYRAAFDANPNIVAGVDSKAQTKADALVAQVKDGVAIGDAYKDVSGKIDNLSKADYEFRQEQLKELTGNIKPTKQMAVAANKSGLDQALCPPGVALDFMRLAKAQFMTYPDWDMAQQKAGEQVAQIYSTTYVNGSKQVMRNAPDKYFPDMFVRSQQIEQLQSLFKKTRDAFGESGNVPYYYELVEDGAVYSGVEPTEYDVDPFSYPADYQFPQIRINQVDSDGNKVQGIATISYDNFTDFPKKGEIVSYSWNFIPDGKNVGQFIFSPEDGYSQARFELTNNEAAKYQKEQRKKQIELDTEQARLGAYRKQQMNKLMNASTDEFLDKLYELNPQVGTDEQQ
jgi:hypothetical protein